LGAGSTKLQIYRKFTKFTNLPAVARRKKIGAGLTKLKIFVVTRFRAPGSMAWSHISAIFATGEKILAFFIKTNVNGQLLHKVL
jgi:hypothetical protein